MWRLTWNQRLCMRNRRDFFGWLARATSAGLLGSALRLPDITSLGFTRLESPQQVVALDVGRSKIRVAVFRLTSGRFKGTGTAASRGWSQGTITDPDTAALAIQEAVKIAERLGCRPIKAAYVTGGGLDFQGLDVTSAIPKMEGGRPVARHQYEGLVKAVNSAGIEIKDFVPECIAVAEACLPEDERELGVALLNIGFYASRLVVFQHGSLRHTATIAVGGDHFTRDLAAATQLPLDLAEKLKLVLGHVMAEAACYSTEPGVTDQVLLPAILKPRAKELLGLTEAQLTPGWLAEGDPVRLRAGLVLVGGGAGLHGLAAMAEDTLKIPVRVGQPRGIGVMRIPPWAPGFAAAAGLARYAARQQTLE